MAITPYLCCTGPAAAIDFYVSAFGATETERWTGDDGRIGHAALDLDGQQVFLADEHPQIGVVSPTTLAGTCVSLVLWVADADAVVSTARACGATVERPVSEQPDGRWAGWIVDPFGHRWNITSSTVTKDLPTGRFGEYEITRGGRTHKP